MEKDPSLFRQLGWWMITIILLLMPGFILSMLEIIRMVFSLARYAN